ncbi:MAG: benzoyl-CoA reductase, bzd-type, subunit N [Chloroflexi bacterium]|nr:benzoyl-CoA reductase, bzd-type, subunit N [Chloroflexota bacterium]
MSPFQKFQEWHQNRHQYAQEWKARTGGKVLGYFCTYVPEEILYAADVLPVRILGSHEPEDVTEPHIFAMFCPFCRDCLAQGLKGRFDYLDGIMISQSCLHIRQAFWSWQLHIPTSFSYYLPMPHHVQSPRAQDYLRGELAQFKGAVEGWTGRTLTDADLDRGMEIMNTNRRLMKQVYELRKAPNPPLVGADAMEMVLSSQMTDKREHNQELAALLEKLPQQKRDGDPPVRLMIIGSEDDDVAFIKMAESLGAVFVSDDHCTGTRYFWNEALPQEDRLMAIAQRYLDRTPCPTKDWPERRRFQQILRLAKEYGVQGALLIQQKFCDPHESDIPQLARLLKENGIPSYFLEFDMTVPLGPFRTRVEAFLETLREEDLF